MNQGEQKDDIKKKLFENFAENLKQMIQSTNESQQELLAIINQLFTYVIDPQTNKKRIIVNPKLTESSLQEIVVKTRSIIIQLYLKCEHDFTQGVKLYQAIVEKQIKDTTLSQLKVLEETTDKLASLDPKPVVDSVDKIGQQEVKPEVLEETPKEDELQKENQPGEIETIKQ
jgi:hypothetical protein